MVAKSVCVKNYEANASALKGKVEEEVGRGKYEEEGKGKNDERKRKNIKMKGE